MGIGVLNASRDGLRPVHLGLVAGDRNGQVGLSQRMLHDGLAGFDGERRSKRDALRIADRRLQDLIAGHDSVDDAVNHCLVRSQLAPGERDVGRQFPGQLAHQALQATAAGRG